MLRNSHLDDGCNLSSKKMSELLTVNRTSIYYEKPSISDLEIKAKHAIDKLHTNNPSWGSRQLSKQLKKDKINIGRLKTRRYMSEMGIEAIYPKPSLSGASKENKKYPYLLRNFNATRANQAWSIDITYIRLHHGFVYLTAIIDWLSRCVVGWSMDDTLGAPMVIRAVENAFAIAKPQILNSDQGSQFTSDEYIKLVEVNNVKISMDGKGRWADNIPIERWFRTLKYEEVYLKDYENLKEARREIGEFIHKYNFERLHSALGYTSPAENYYPVQILALMSGQSATGAATLDRAS